MANKKTEIESERKFVLKRLPDVKFKEVLHIMQYYKDGYRYRMQQIISPIAGAPEYWKIKKVKLGVGINEEQEIEQIDMSTFYSNRAGAIEERHEINKYRYVVEENEKKFEIDLFKNNVHLVMMEVEGVTVKEKIPFPEEIKKEILLEVTGNDNFDNYNLAI